MTGRRPELAGNARQRVQQFGQSPDFLKLDVAVILENRQILHAQRGCVFGLALFQQVPDQLEGAAKLVAAVMRDRQQFAQPLPGVHTRPAQFVADAVDGLPGQRIFFGEFRQFGRHARGRLRGLQAAHQHPKDLLFHQNGFFTARSDAQPLHRPAQRGVFKDLGGHVFFGLPALAAVQRRHQGIGPHFLDDPGHLGVSFLRVFIGIPKRSFKSLLYHALHVRKVSAWARSGAHAAAGSETGAAETGA